MQNKMMDGAVNKSSPPLTEYFFPGSGQWKPMTVKAASREEAEEIHRSKREPVSQEENKVEASKETSNE